MADSTPYESAVGTYSILVEQKGFKRAVQGGQCFAADARLTVDITLELGELSETVEVTSSAAGETVNTTSGEVARWLINVRCKTWP